MLFYVSAPDVQDLHGQRECLYHGLLHPGEPGRKPSVILERQFQRQAQRILQAVAYQDYAPWLSKDGQWGLELERQAVLFRVRRVWKSYRRDVL